MTKIVDVEVTEVRRSGLVVGITNSGKDGFIRRRDLSWDRRIHAELPVYRIGEKVRAAIVSDKPTDPYIYLSLRWTSDPWRRPGLGDRYSHGRVVRGEVVNIRGFGAFVQLEPGIDAFLDRANVPLLPNHGIEMALSIGDEVQGLVTVLNLPQRKIEISLFARLQQLAAMPADRRRSYQLDLFAARLEPPIAKTASYQSETPRGKQEDAPLRRYRRPIERPERILVIDDSPNDLQLICQALREALRVEVDGAASGAQALEMLHAGSVYDLVVLDYVLNNENSKHVAMELLALTPRTSLIFTSANPLFGEQAINISGRRLPCSFKDPAELAEWIEKLSSGYWEEVRRSETTGTSAGGFVYQLGLTTVARRPLSEVLQEILAKLRRDTKVSQCMVVEVDTLAQTVAVLGADPPIKQETMRRLSDALFFSPVRTVVEDEEEFYVTDIDRENDQRFQYFFQPFSYKVCLGLPLEIPDFVTHHALFLLSDTRAELGDVDIYRARLVAQQIQIALERDLMLEFMRRYEQRYTQGQLLGGLIHELRNKLDAQSGSINMLLSGIQKTKTADAAAQSSWLQRSEKLALDIARSKNDINDLVSAYSRTVRSDLEPVDANLLVRKAKSQLDALARSTNVRIFLEEQADLSPAKANGPRLEQIVLNLGLNAIQQFDVQRQSMARIGRKTPGNLQLSQEGQLIFRTRQVIRDRATWVQIAVIDSGPGIHYHQQERLFQLDTSTRRKGHGLGLFISFSLAESMGGRLRLADSLMFMGSAFVVEVAVWQGSRR